MIILLKNGCDNKSIKELTSRLTCQGVNAVYNEIQNSVFVTGNTFVVDTETVSALPFVESVIRITRPFALAERAGKKDTVVSVGGFSVGGGNFGLIAGPCTVESEELTVAIARIVKKHGATMLRGGAFKPRTSPYAFQGLGKEGVEILLTAKRETGLPIVSEVLNVRSLDLFQDIDVLQVGARNMQNFELLKELGKSDKPILLKRGMGCTVEEWLLAAEYILKEGNEKVILCERGIRTFETSARNTLDLSSIPFIKEHSHLPVIVDPSHAAGKSAYVTPLSLASIGAGADGLMIEVHVSPEDALCDGPQALTEEAFSILSKKIKATLCLR